MASLPPTDALQAALDDYLTARESGSPFAREEFLQRYPTLALELQGILETLDAVRTSPSPPSLLIHSLGEYQILGIAGQGGMGVVYEAFQLQPPRRVALKTLAPNLADQQSLHRRILTEISITGRLHHTNIVPVLAVVSGEHGPIAYAMPYINGSSVAAVIRTWRGDANGIPPDSPLTIHLNFANDSQRIRSITEWMRQAAEAVGAAHNAGITHRDIKPANLLIEFDRKGHPHIWLNDFGLAVVEGDPIEDERPVGTPGYMSPEQCAGNTAGRLPTTDVYSLGITLAELLTLKKPTHDSYSVLLAQLPHELQRVIAKATAVNPCDRYSTATGMADDLAKILAGYPVQAGRPAILRTVSFWALRHRRAIAAAGLGFVSAMCLATVFLYRAYTAERSARIAAEAARSAVAMHTLAIDDTLYANVAMRDTHRKLLEQAVAVHQQHRDHLPSDLAALRQFAQASWRLGRVQVMQGHANEGIAWLQESITAYQHLSYQEPTQLLHRLDLARSHSVLAWAYLTQANRDSEKTAIAEAFQVASQAMLDFPENRFVRDAWGSYAAEHADKLIADHRYTEAEPILRRAITHTEDCYHAEPERWQFAGAVIGTHMRLARFYAAQGRLVEALAANTHALKLNATLLERALAPKTDIGQLELISLRMTRVDLLEDRGQWVIAFGAEIGPVLKDLSTIAQEIAVRHPDRVRNEAVTIATLQAWQAYRMGKHDHDAERILEAHLASSPFELSRYFADGPGRNPTQAITQARTALQHSADDLRNQMALGLALYRAGELDAATIRLAAISGRPPSRSAGLVRAAIAARKGQFDEARRLFIEAQSSNLSLELCHPELLREVENLLATGKKSSAATRD